MSPFFAKLASLNSAQKAMAANFGYLPGGQTKAVQQALSTSSAMASASLFPNKFNNGSPAPPEPLV